MYSAVSYVVMESNTQTDGDQGQTRKSVHVHVHVHVGNVKIICIFKIQKGMRDY